MRRLPDEAIPSVYEQTVVLNFEGARGVRIGSRPAVDVPAFDAAGINTSLAGQAPLLNAKVLELVRRDFAPYGVSVISSAEADQLRQPASIVYFGTYDPNLLGLADHVDPFNHVHDDKAIVFTETFRLFMSMEPDIDELAQALANVASHEIGHLLGLVHTADPNSLMDITASASRMLEDQQFTICPLHETVFPVGWQNAVLLLGSTVGLRPEVDVNTLTTPKFARIARPARIISPFLGKMCGTCTKNH